MASGDKIPAFTRSTMNYILEIVDYFKRVGFTGEAGSGLVVSNAAPIWFKNDSAETIPAWSVMRIKKTLDENGRNYVVVGKPNATTVWNGQWLVNGPRDVADQTYGTAQNGQVLRIKGDGSTRTEGFRWAPVSGQWTIAPNPLGGFLCGGADDIDTNLARVIWCGSNVVGTMKSTSSISAASGASWGSGTGKIQDDSSGTAVDFTGPDSETFSETFYNTSPSSLASGAHMQFKRNMISGLLMIDVASC